MSGEAQTLGKLSPTKKKVYQYFTKSVGFSFPSLGILGDCGQGRLYFLYITILGVLLHNINMPIIFYPTPVPQCSEAWGLCS